MGGWHRLERKLRSSEARYRGDIFSEGYAVVYRLDVHDINADNGRGAWHLLGANLHPATGGSAQVDDGLCILQKLIHEGKVLPNVVI